jgi:hypothetical protein
MLGHETCVLEANESASVRLGPFSLDGTVVVKSEDGSVDALVICSLVLGVRDRLGGDMPVSFLTDDIAHVERGSRVTIRVKNNGSVTKTVVVGVG